MAAKHDLPPGGLFKIVHGTHPSFRRWMLHEVRLRGEAERRLTRGEVLTFVHSVTGEEFSGTRIEITQHIGDAHANVHYVTTGRAKQAKGWYLKGNPPPTHRRGEVATLVHPTKGEVTGTQKELVLATGLSRSVVGNLVRRKCISGFGWTVKVPTLPAKAIEPFSAISLVF
jgi:hypothetical protein